jgi:glycosyltransferase involved in cell wall biosynthesis
MKNNLGVIIPTYNRRQTLENCLNTLLQQDAFEKILEVIIVDDGSTDDTGEFIKEIKRMYPQLKYLYQKNSGPAVARNQGIKIAQADIILFIGDDIIPTPSLVRQHLEWHSQHPEVNEAVLGYTTWSPELEITNFMRWLENGGPLLCYPLIKDKIEVDFRFFYTGNISLKTSWLKENLFSEDFPYGYEDTELGYRLAQKGLKLYYNKDALAYHYHSMNLEDFEKRMIRWGQAAKIFLGKYPELKTYIKIYPLHFLKFCKLVSFFLYPLAALFNYPKIINHYRYQNRLMQAFTKGYHNKN